MMMMMMVMMRYDERAARCSTGLGGTRAFLRYDRPIRSCVEKKRICRGRGSQRIQSEACAANTVAKKGQRTHVVGGPWSFSSGVSKKGLCGHNSHVLTLMGTTPLDQPTPPMLRCVLILTLQSATTTTSDLTTTHWSGRKVQGRANGFC